MSRLRRFHGAPTTRLIVSVEDSFIEALDAHIGRGSRHPASGNRAEFVRLAIEEKLVRDKAALNKRMVSKG